MANYKGTDTDLIAVANAIRVKGGAASLLEWPSGYISAINAIPTPLEIVPWSTGTDEQIVAMIQAAHNGTIDLQQDGEWAVGDLRTIHISGEYDEDIDLLIVSFDDYENCGCVLQFDFNTCLSKLKRSYSSRSTSSGYGGSEMKNSTLPALVTSLPSWLQSLLIEFSCEGSGGTEGYVSGNKLALRSAYEYNFSSPAAVEGDPLSYYNSFARKTKTQGKSGSSGIVYATRTVSTGQKIQCVANNGTGSTANADSSIGFAPFGCI